MQQFTSMELLERLEARREVRNLMGRISHDYAVKQEADIYRRYWSRREDVCLGLNSGYYRGADAVSGYYDALGQEIALASRLIQQRFPEQLGDKSAEEVYGVGLISYVPFESQVVEIADDFQTAKGLWNVRGSTSRLTSAGPVANWIFGWAAADFILEDGAWKLWHLLLVYNIDHQCGVGFCQPEKVFAPVPEFAEMDSFRLPEPNVPEPAFTAFYPERPKTTSPKYPEPYDTFTNTFSYGL